MDLQSDHDQSDDESNDSADNWFRDGSEEGKLLGFFNYSSACCHSEVEISWWMSKWMQNLYMLYDRIGIRKSQGGN